MNEAERRAVDLARAQHQVITTRQALACGMSESAIRRRLLSERWLPIFRGAHLIGLGPVLWAHRAHAAGLLAGEGSGLSRRTAGAVFELDACGRGPIEVVVPYPRQLEIPGVICHRSRVLERAEIRVWSGMPVTRIERTLTELGHHLPPVMLEKAIESAYRRKLTSPDALQAYLDDLGHRLVGARRLERVLLARGEAAAIAGSAAEVELIAALRERGIEPPVRQYKIDLGGGWVVKVDLCWPWRRLVVEYYGREAHASSAATSYDYDRENALNDAGYGVRRFGSGDIRRDPDHVAARIATALERHPLVAPIGAVDGL